MTYRGPCATAIVASTNSHKPVKIRLDDIVGCEIETREDFFSADTKMADAIIAKSPHLMLGSEDPCVHPAHFLSQIAKTHIYHSPKAKSNLSRKKIPCKATFPLKVLFQVLSDSRFPGAIL